MSKPPYRVLSHDEKTCLLNSLYQQGRIRDWSLIHLCLNTGLRNAEACLLNNHHIEKFGTIVAVLDINEEIAHSQSRQLPLTAPVQGALKTYLQYKETHHQQLEPNAPFFTTLRTHLRLRPIIFQRIMERSSEMLGFKITPHDLRHTFATQLYQITNDLEAVRRALGLRSTKAVQIYKKYAPVDEKQLQLQQAVETLR